MAAKVNVCNVSVMDNPSPFSNSFRFHVTFECFEKLEEDLEWKLTYVGSAESDKYDQILDSVLVGPVPEGRHMFEFKTGGPDSSKIPSSEIVGVTVILLSCAYREQEFIKIGYFVQNDYEDPELKENPPEQPQLDKLVRSILSDYPRVTRFQIKWGDQQGDIMQEQIPVGSDEEASMTGGESSLSSTGVSGPSAISAPAEKPQQNGGLMCDGVDGNVQDMRNQAKKINAGKIEIGSEEGAASEQLTNGDAPME